jgi:GNAT superfamily N-acetyltransferase
VQLSPGFGLVHVRGLHLELTPANMIAYRAGSDLDLDATIDVYRSSGLGEYRPVDDREAMRAMFAAANIVVSAWDGDKLVGVARSLSDFVFCTYLADLAVRDDYQRRGIGKELMRRTQKAGKSATIFLFAAPRAVSYYEHLGLEPGSGWTMSPLKRLR